VIDMPFKMNPRGYGISVFAIVLSTVAGVGVIAASIYADFIWGSILGVLIIAVGILLPMTTAPENLATVYIEKRGIFVYSLGKQLIHLVWENVSCVGAGLYNTGSCSELFIYISEKKELNDKQVCSLERLNAKVNRHTVKVAYTAEVLEVIQKYWESDVAGFCPESFISADTDILSSMLRM
jgi:hypothetical protein